MGRCYFMTFFDPLPVYTPMAFLPPLRPVAGSTPSMPPPSPSRTYAHTVSPIHKQPSTCQSINSLAHASLSRPAQVCPPATPACRSLSGCLMINMTLFSGLEEMGSSPTAVASSGPCELNYHATMRVMQAAGRRYGCHAVVTRTELSVFDSCMREQWTVQSV